MELVKSKKASSLNLNRYRRCNFVEVSQSGLIAFEGQFVSGLISKASEFFYAVVLGAESSAGDWI